MWRVEGDNEISLLQTGGFKENASKRTWSVHIVQLLERKNGLQIVG